MFMRVRSILPCAILALAIAVRAQETVSEGRHVVVRSSVASQPLADRVRDAVEAAIPVYEKHLSCKLGAGDKLVMNLYETADQYAAAVTAAGAANLVSNQAATANKTNETYLVVTPRSEAAYLQAVDHLPEMTHFLVCHEGVHQMLRRTKSATEQLWPFWYAEGMADHVAEACLRAGADGAKRPIPYVETRRHNVGEWLSQGRLPALSRVLGAEVDAMTVAQPLYACSYSLFDFLAADSARSGKFNSDVRRLGGVSSTIEGAAKRDFARTFAKTFTEAFGPVEALETGWREHIAKTRAAWFEPMRSSQFIRDEVVVAGFGTSNAALISTRKPDRDPTLGCEVDILGSGARQADLYFGFEAWDTRFVKVALGASGYVTLLVFDHGWKPDQRVSSSVSPETFRTGTWTAVEATVADGRIRVSVAGKTALEAPLPKDCDTARNLVGVGACEGSAVRFRKLALNGKEPR